MHNTVFQFPVSDAAHFEQTIEKAISEFPKNALLRKIDTGATTLKDYHNLLKMIFQQTYFSSASFALAGAMCPPRRHAVRDYFIHHAEEEKTHWRWILDDLKNTDYKGVDPSQEFPAEPCQAYIAFNFYVSLTMPIARLGIATMLETLSARYGGDYARKLCASLKLKPNQASFFLKHADADTHHARNLLKIIEVSEPSPEEWGWLCYAAETACKMYHRMYHEIA